MTQRALATQPMSSRHRFKVPKPQPVSCLSQTCYHTQHKHSNFSDISFHNHATGEYDDGEGWAGEVLVMALGMGLCDKEDVGERYGEARRRA